MDTAIEMDGTAPKSPNFPLFQSVYSPNTLCTLASLTRPIAFTRSMELRRRVSCINSRWPPEIQSTTECV